MAAESAAKRPNVDIVRHRKNMENHAQNGGVSASRLRCLGNMAHEGHSSGPRRGGAMSGGGTMNYGGKISGDVQKCIDACIESYSCCEQSITHCLNEGGRLVEMSIMGPLMDCVDVTRTCADMMMRQSPLSMEMAAVCARITDLCAEACMTMSNDPAMKRCAGICRTCSEACRSLAGVRA
jgi:hypothetical protein